MVWVPLLLGLILLSTGLLTRWFPPEKINNYYGYRTAASKRSQQAWDFANRYMSTQFLIVGSIVPLGALAVAVTPLAFHQIIIFLEPAAAFLWIYVRTERAIVLKFDTDGRPRSGSESS